MRSNCDAIVGDAGRGLGWRTLDHLTYSSWQSGDPEDCATQAELICLNLGKTHFLKNIFY